MIRTIVHHSDRNVRLIENDIVSTFNEIQPGFYDICLDRNGKLEGLAIRDLPKVYPLLPSDSVDNVNKFIDIFISENYKDILDSNNMLRRDGILLEGDPGIGKTNYINYYIKRLIENTNAIVFNCSTYSTLLALSAKLQDIRLLQSNLIVIVLEEFESMLSYNNAESALKNMLDGINGVNDQLALATTNYIEKIPESLKNRKSRFKYVVNLTMSNDKNRVKEWLKYTISGIIKDVTDDDLLHLVDVCHNRSIDDIKHICLDFKLGLDFLPSKKSIGFGQ